MGDLNLVSLIDFSPSRNPYQDHQCRLPIALTSDCPRSIARSEAEACWEGFEGRRKEKREQAGGVGAVTVGAASRDRAPVCGSEQMVALAGTGAARAHPQEGAKHRRIHLFFPLAHFRPLWLPAHSTLISTSCPHLPACWPRRNMACGRVK